MGGGPRAPQPICWVPAAPLLPARPGTGRGGRLPGVPRVAARRPGAGAEERREAQGPPPRPLCPCAPPPGPAVAGGGRWPVAEAAPGPLGTALSIDSNLPLPTPHGKKKKGPWIEKERGRWDVGCDLILGYVCGKGKGRQRPGIRPSRGTQLSAGRGDGTNTLQRDVLRNVNLGDRWMESHVPVTSPRRGCSLYFCRCISSQRLRPSVLTLGSCLF